MGLNKGPAAADHLVGAAVAAGVPSNYIDCRQSFSGWGVKGTLAPTIGAFHASVS